MPYNREMRATKDDKEKKYTKQFTIHTHIVSMCADCLSRFVCVQGFFFPSVSPMLIWCVDEIYLLLLLFVKKEGKARIVFFLLLIFRARLFSIYVHFFPNMAAKFLLHFFFLLSFA